MPPPAAARQASAALAVNRAAWGELETIPVRVILDTEAPLVGAAHYAVTLAARSRPGAPREAERT